MLNCASTIEVTVSIMFSLRSFFASIRSVILLWICLLSPSTGFIIKSPLFAAVRSCSRNPSSSSSSHQNNQLMMNAPARVPNKRDRKVESILEAVDFSRRPVPSQIPLMDDPLMGMIGSILNAADARKATYLSAFRISSVTGITLAPYSLLFSLPCISIFLYPFILYLNFSSSYHDNNPSLLLISSQKSQHSWW